MVSFPILFHLSNLNNTMGEILDWSEVWATSLPLLVLILKKKDRKELATVVIYIYFAFLLNIIIDSANLKYFDNNLFLYNMLSIVRLYSFIWFFIKLKIPAHKNWQHAIVVVPFLLISVNFLFFESFKNFSS